MLRRCFFLSLLLPVILFSGCTTREGLEAAGCLGDSNGPETVMVPMRDGVKLATDIYVPAGEDQAFPVLVMRTVYGRGGKAMNATGEACMGRGYVFVSQDTRGRGDSEGTENTFFDDGWGERQDGADLIAWIGAQPWCNGKIGTWGGSALGITQVLMAGACQAITCQSIQVASSNMYGQLSYQGGVFRKALCEDWLEMQKIPYMVDTWHSHPTYDDFWKLLNAEPRAPQVTAPAVHVGGWWDIFCQGTINNFTTRQYQGGTGARGNQKLIMGAWPHGPRKEVGDLVLRDNFTFDFGAYEQRFQDYWLKEVQNGIMQEPAVNYYTLGDVTNPDAPGNEWRTANDWPPFPTVETAYFLQGDRSLSTAPATEPDNSLSYVYDPANPCPTHGGAELTLPAGPFDQQTVGNRPDVLVFLSAPLEAPLEVTGNVRVRLYVSTDAPDTDFTAKFVDVYPDGRQYLMLDNIRRLKFRNGYEQAEPLAPGTVGELVIDLWSISLILDKGHRIGLHVSSSNYPRFEKNPNTGEDLPGAETRAATNAIHLDQAHPSALLLPVHSDT